MTDNERDESQDHEPVRDACPAWADQLIRQILDLEIRLGNLRPSKGAEAEWQKSQVDSVWQRVYGDADQARVDEDTVEALFRRVALGLAEAGFEPPEIAAFINARVHDAGGLPYCNAAEVAEALRAQLN